MHKYAEKCIFMNLHCFAIWIQLEFGAFQAEKVTAMKASQTDGHLENPIGVGDQMDRLKGARFSGRSLHSLKTAVIGARGYSGAELVRLLLKHPAIELVRPVATAQFDMKDVLSELRQSLIGSDLSSFMKEAGDFDIVFLATPNETSAELAHQLLQLGVCVIDVSGAHRLRTIPGETAGEAYSTWYKMKTHPSLDWVENAEYGMVPFVDAVSNAQLIANPGCFATAANLAVIPLLRSELIELDQPIFIDAKSGTTGAGKKAEERLIFSEVADAVLPYRIGEHQHQPEIVRSWARFGLGSDGLATKVKIEFVPHLLPVRRGIILSAYCHVRKNCSPDELHSSFQAAYSADEFIELINLNSRPADAQRLSLRRVVGTPRTAIGFKKLSDSRAVVFAVIDNLMKGAASQAVENFNRLCGLPLNTGLSQREALV